MKTGVILLESNPGIFKLRSTLEHVIKTGDYVLVTNSQTAIEFSTYCKFHSKYDIEPALLPGSQKFKMLINRFPYCEWPEEFKKSYEYNYGKYHDDFRKRILSTITNSTYGTSTKGDTVMCDNKQPFQSLQQSYSPAKQLPQAENKNEALKVLETTEQALKDGLQYHKNEESKIKAEFEQRLGFNKERHDDFNKRLKEVTKAIKAVKKLK